MTTAVTRLTYGRALGTGLALLLASAAPASAQFIDIFGYPNQPPRAFPNADYSRPAQTPRKPQREPHRETKQRKHEAAPDQGPPRGPYQIVVAIAKQQVALYGRNGLIARAGISTGVPEHPTPLGVFTVISKARWHESNIYSGAPMPYMQRITWSGIALHAGPRPGYPASHGCIRLPEDFAIRLFHITKVGARVIVTREPAAPVEIASLKLFVPKLAEEKPVAVAAADTTKADVSLAAKTTAPKSSASESSAPRSSDAAPPKTEATADANGAIAVPPVALPPASAPPRPQGPVSVFVSRKQGKVFVRQGFTALFDMPVTIAEPDRPLGTHVFTAVVLEDGGKAMRWTVVSVPSQYRRQKIQARKPHHGREPEAEQAAAPTAAEALGRVTLPPEAVERISELLKPGSSLIVSDNALSDETDESTDFIVLTP